MNLLFSLNESYIPPLKVLLRSLFDVHPNETFHIYLMHAGIKKEKIEELTAFCKKDGHTLNAFECTDFFKKADKVALTRYYTLEMYLWMYAPYILPKTVDRILYLDPDIINMKSISTFYEKDFGKYYFVATNYKYKTKWVQPFNNLRLRNFDSESYFNSGVVLMNVKRLREVGSPEEITEAIKENYPFLLLPDQDIFNLLYDSFVLEEDWRIYNMNPKVYEKLKVLFPHKYNKNWIEENVVFIHYCGKHKPWNEREKYRYALGKYYFEVESRFHPLFEKGAGR
jgi:lipopolysaccharide biosynthesis glycosyltransferase